MVLDKNALKIARNKALIDLKNNTMLSFAELGNIFSISKQAAWAIYQRNHRGKYDK